MRMKKKVMMMKKVMKKMGEDNGVEDTEVVENDEL